MVYKVHHTSSCVKKKSASSLGLMHYFSNIHSIPYVSNPFFVDPSVLPVGTGEQEEIIDIQSEEAAKIKHKECSPVNFWVTMSSTHPTLAQKAVPHLLVFPSTWKCKQGFSAMMSIKNKSRNRLTSTAQDQDVSGSQKSCCHCLASYIVNLLTVINS